MCAVVIVCRTKGATVTGTARRARWRCGARAAGRRSGGSGLWRADELAQVEIDEVEDDPQVGERALGRRVQHVADADDPRMVEMAQDAQLPQRPLRLRHLREAGLNLLDRHLLVGIAGVLGGPHVAICRRKRLGKGPGLGNGCTHRRRR